MSTIAVEDSFGKIIIDTRSPKEFEEDHMPGAINVPILDNDERAMVGTLYKQVSRDKAIEKGMELFHPKLPEFLKVFEKHKDNEVVVSCWRGGMRSRTVVALFDSLGFNVLQLRGGYKAYREFVRDRLYGYDFKPKLVVLSGLTCTGKTELLQNLVSIDLEGLAQHRSSLYGAVGLIPRSQKMFETLLLQKLHELNDENTVFIEGESRRIGNVIIPENLWKKMKKGTQVLITRSMEERAKLTVREYFTPDNVEKIKEITESLWKVISNDNKQNVLEAIDSQDYTLASKILLEKYYDPLYGNTLDNISFDGEVNSNNVSEAVEALKKFI